MAKGIKLACVCVTVCACNENQQKAKAQCLSEGAPISCDHRILFSFQKNHLKMTFYTTWICLFMCPHTGIVWGAILIAEWLGEEGKRMGTHRMRKVEGDWCSTCGAQKNNGAISVSHCRYLNEHPITQAAVSLQRGTRVPNETSFDVTPLYVHNLWAISQWLHSDWGPETMMLERFLLTLSRSFSLSTHLSILNLSMASIH